MTHEPRSVADLDFTPRNGLFSSPADWRDLFIYFLLVDRFDDNDPQTPPLERGVTPQGRHPAEGRRFQGGTLRGVIRRLDYIQGLGANAIWLSPIFKNRQELDDVYHGYGVQDFLAIDPRFGTLADLQELVRAAHARGMYVIQDVIINHSGDNWGYPGDHPYYFWHDAPGPFPFGFWREHDPGAGLQPDDAVWPLELQRPDAYKRRGQIRDFNDSRQSLDGDFFTLKELDLAAPGVLDTLIKAYKHWIALTDIDGFRIDTVKHMESSATAIFCNAVREYAKSVGKQRFFLFGEIVADDATIRRYLGRNARIDGTNERFPSLDAALDFPLYFVLEEVIKGLSNPAVLRARQEGLRSAYADHGEAGQSFVTFVDNHDQMSRPYRRFMHANPFPRQAVLALGYLLTSPGVPCIYYGTEQGLDGGGSHDSFVRECLFGGRWGAFDTTGHHCFDPDNPTYREIARIAAIRRAEPALRYGRQYFREISGNGSDFGYPLDGRCTLAYSRILDTTELLIALNLDGQPRDEHLTVDAKLSPAGAELTDLLDPARRAGVREQGGRHSIHLPLPAHGFAIMKRTA